MKKFITSILLIISTTIFSQNTDQKTIIDYKLKSSEFSILKDSIKKPGIYLTYEEFRDNNPSLKLENKIIYNEEKYSIGFMKSGKLKFYAVDIPKKAGRKIGEVFGFSDGLNFYLIYSRTDGNFNYLHNFQFNQLNYLGKYCYFETIGSSSIGNINVASIIIKLINLKTGEIEVLTKNLLKKIISDNPQILTKFNNDENKYIHFKEYLDDYLLH